jgi:hypothetical protein
MPSAEAATERRVERRLGRVWGWEEEEEEEEAAVEEEKEDDGAGAWWEDERGGDTVEEEIGDGGTLRGASLYFTLPSVSKGYNEEGASVFDPEGPGVDVLETVTISTSSEPSSSSEPEPDCEPETSSLSSGERDKAEEGRIGTDFKRIASRRIGFEKSAGASVAATPCLAERR